MGDQKSIIKENGSPSNSNPDVERERPKHSYVAENYKGKEAEKKSSEAMGKSQGLYDNHVPEFSEDLTFTNFGGPTSNGVKPKRKKEDLDAIYEQLSGKVADLTFSNFGNEALGQINENDKDSLASSIDFSKALQAVKPSARASADQPNGNNRRLSEDSRIQRPSTDRTNGNTTSNGNYNLRSGEPSNGLKRKNYPSPSMDSISGVASTMTSPQVGLDYGKPGAVITTKEAAEVKTLSKRPGIPHSNVCSVCGNYVYVFRHRCLVCGRVYCRQCVKKGMGDMPEGRKCISCVGHRFSQRYIDRAAQVGYCLSLPSSAKSAELKWAELGPRKPRNGSSSFMSSTLPLPGSPMSSKPGTPVRRSARVSPVRGTRPDSTY